MVEGLLWVEDEGRFGLPAVRENLALDLGADDPVADGLHDLLCLLPVLLFGGAPLLARHLHEERWLSLGFKGRNLEVLGSEDRRGFVEGDRPVLAVSNADVLNGLLPLSSCHFEVSSLLGKSSQGIAHHRPPLLLGLLGRTIDGILVI